jgi:hypothetical protein
MLDFGGFQTKEFLLVESICHLALSTHETPLRMEETVRLQQSPEKTVVLDCLQKLSSEEHS